MDFLNEITRCHKFIDSYYATEGTNTEICTICLTLPTFFFSITTDVNHLYICDKDSFKVWQKCVFLVSNQCFSETKFFWHNDSNGQFLQMGRFLQ